MKDDRFWVLLSRHLAHEASEEEEGELKVLIEKSEEMKIRYESILMYWGKSQHQIDINSDRAYSNVLDRIDKVRPQSQMKVKSNYLHWVVRLAASIVLAMVAGWYFYTPTASQKILNALTWSSKTTAKGERTKITLSDGSSVWLNADSEIRYPKEFDGGAREIYLSGEAFFEVTKNPAKPFIIHLSNGDVRVLGTSFNIKAFDDEPNIETSVLTGKVAFIGTSLNSQRDTIRITPNYKVVYSKHSRQAKKQPTNSIDDKSWVDGRLVFKSQRFDEVAKVLERNFGTTIIFGNEDLKNCKLTGTFQNNSLKDVMELFSNTKDYTYTISENECVIGGSGCSPQ